MTSVTLRTRNVTPAIVPAIHELSTDDPERQMESGANCAAAMPV